MGSQNSGLKSRGSYIESRLYSKINSFYILFCKTRHVAGIFNQLKQFKKPKNLYCLILLSYFNLKTTPTCLYITSLQIISNFQKFQHNQLQLKIQIFRSKMYTNGWPVQNKIDLLLQQPMHIRQKATNDATTTRNLDVSLIFDG